MKGIYLKENAVFIEVKIILDEQEIGRAEIKTDNNELCNFQIFEPFQNKGFVQQALNLLIKKYNINNLLVKSDNEKAKHIYKKFGFELKEPLFYEMKLKEYEK